MQQIIGWSASIVLVGTIISQIYRQWRHGSSKGVSTWLFIGQIVASTGFVVYSWLVNDLVFIFTNVLLLLSALVGLSIVLWHRHANPEEADPGVEH
jgi:MtN3 and saliva related transmembrane protein